MTHANTLPPELQTLETRTLSNYEARAEDFWQGTRDHDVTQNYEALLSALGHRKDLRILDFGCGPGRDLAAFRALGHVPTGLDGCESFVSMARAYSRCEVLHQSFFALRLPPRSFDGIFANASLFHVPSKELPRVLSELHSALAPDGVLFCSNPRSFDVDHEGWNGERFGTFLTQESWTRYFEQAGFTLERTYLRPDGKQPEEQPWLAMVWSSANHVPGNSGGEER